MTAIERNQARNSTDLLTREMERSGQVLPSDAKALQWKSGHETMEQARTRLREEPLAVMPKLVSFAKQAQSVAKSVATAGTLVSAGPAGVGAAGFAGSVAVLARGVTAGDVLRQAADRDAMDLAVVDLVELDQGYKDSEIKRLDGISANKIEASLRTWEGGVPKLTERGRVVVPALQASADEGMRAALDALSRGGEGVAAYARENPAMMERKEKDIAFAKGWDSVVFAAGFKDGPARLDKIREQLDARQPIEHQAMVRG